MTQVRFICPYCGRVEQFTDTFPGSFDLNRPCVHTLCTIGLKNKILIIVFDPVACLGCPRNEWCIEPRVFPLPGKTLKQLRKRKVR